MLSKSQKRKLRRKRVSERWENTAIDKLPQSEEPNLMDEMERKTTWKRDEIPNEIVKYYHQRYSLFSKYDEGIRMDYDGWFSVTPEKIAIHIAHRMKCNTIVDAFCGVGGNAIQFAKTCSRVIAIDIDPVRLDCAKHNARIYGVEDKIEFVLGDFTTLASTLRADAVFLSPPWGGPSYLYQDQYDIHEMPIDGKQLFEISSQITDNIVYFVPRNIIHDQFIELAGLNRVCEMEKTFLDNRVKCWTIYYGDYVSN
jgi:trimethylguanosine synthase